MDLHTFRDQLQAEAARIQDAMGVLGYLSSEARSLASSADKIDEECREKLEPIMAIIEGLDQLDENRTITSIQMSTINTVRDSTHSLDSQLDELRGVMFDG